MSSTIDIDVKVNGEGLSKLDDATHKVHALGEAAGEAAGNGSGSQGFNALTIAVGQFIGGVAVELGHALPQIVDQLYKMGVESLRAKQGFEAMGGSADAIQKMQAAAHYLIDDTVALQVGTLALGAGVVKTTADLTELARIGATLGVTFKGSAAEGVTAFTTALDSVGNVRALRTLGIDTLAVKERFEELKKTMTDQEAWKMAVFEVAGANATKLATNLDGAGTAVERLSVRFEDAKESLGEWVAEGLDKAASSLENIEKQWNILAANPNLSLTVTINEVNKGATNGLNDLNAALTKWLNDTAHGATINGESGNVHPIGSPMVDQAPKIVPYGGDANSPEIGRDPYAGGGWQSPWQRNHAGSPIGGDQMYWQRRNRATSYDQGIAGNDALRDEFVKPYESAHKHATELENVKSLLGDIGDLAGVYNNKLQAALDPLKKQQELIAHRKSIQSVDDAFGVTHDGLYSQIGSGFQNVIDRRREQAEKDARRKATTRLKTPRPVIDRKTGKQKVDKDGKPVMQTTVFNQSVYNQQMQQFDKTSKAVYEGYLIGTGQATKESLRFNDMLEQQGKLAADGKISLETYKNEMLLMAEAAKSGATSMDQLTQIQIRLNYGLKMGVTTKGKTAQSDASLYEQHAGGVKGTKSYAGNGIENATKPFDDIVVSADKASAAAETFGSKAGQAVVDVAKGAVNVADGFFKAVSALQNTSSEVDTLKRKIAELQSVSITITTTSKSGGTGGRTGRVGGVQGPPR